MSDDIPEWAKAEAIKRLNAVSEEVEYVSRWSSHDYHRPSVLVPARLIAKHEQPPVDPLLVMAREAVIRAYEALGYPDTAADYRGGQHSETNDPELASALTALRMAQEQGLPE